MEDDLSFIEKFLNNQIKASVKADIKPLLNKSKHIGGFFAIPVLTFTLVEYLGALRYGEGSSANAVQFVRVYFGRVNSRYSDIGGLLYDMYRHGTVHTREPKKYVYKDHRIFGWKIVKGENYEDHLKLSKGLYLSLVIDVLYNDLNKAIDFLHDDLKKSIGLRASFIENYNYLKGSVNVEDELNNKSKKKYLTQDDFAKLGKIKNIFEILTK